MRKEDCTCESWNCRFRFHERTMGAEAADLHSHLITQLLHKQWIFLHGKRMEITYFAEQFPSGVDHWFDVFVSQGSRDLYPSAKTQIGASDEFHIDG